MTRLTTATDLLNAYLDSVSRPEAAGALFADDGILELPTVNARAQGPAAVADLLTGLLRKIPDFAFQAPTFWIQTPDRVFAEYRVEALVPDTGKVYRQVYAGLLIAEGGRIKLLREALDTAEAARAFRKD
ncbi:MAG: nuclear transport factor 2 family protein [Pseudacidovorax sp.]|nr:nuclear transport factor 2 family protein [Pseudacidovorax sp.]